MKKRRHNKLSKRHQFSFLNKLRSRLGVKIIARQRLKGRDLNKKYGLINQKLKKGWANR